MPRYEYEPRDDNNKVHDVPSRPQVGTLVHDEAKGNDFEHAFNAKNGHENGLCFLL
jgi:hypothetical protein